MSINQGQAANLTGKELEKAIEDVLKELSIPFKAQAKFTGIYNNSCKVDFITDEYVIECKSQSVSGSVDEKIPYTCLNLLQAAKELNKKPCLILFGSHFALKKGIKDWVSSNYPEISIIANKEEFVTHIKVDGRETQVTK